MTAVTIKDYRSNPEGLLRRAIRERKPIHVDTEDGGGILLSEEEYRGLKETLYLMSIPGMKEKLIQGMKTPAEECDDFEW